MARWTRARDRLELPLDARVLDLGCAFGFGTRLLVRRYRAFGHDLDRTYIEQAHRTVPDATFSHGPADRVPYPDAFFDGVLLLDVLEHVPDERAVLAEVARVLRPGGRLVLSVPNAGLLARLDSLNLYRRLLGPEAAPPTDDPSWPRSPRHRHYCLEEIRRLLDPNFCILTSEYTGLGIAEPINLLLLLLLRGLFHAPRLYGALQYLYFGVYLVEDMITTGAWGYHLMIVAERV